MNTTTIEPKMYDKLEEILLSQEVEYWDWLRCKGTTPNVYAAIINAMYTASLRGTGCWVKATGYDKESGWTYDLEFLKGIAEKVREKEWGNSLDLEEIESVLEVIESELSNEPGCKRVEDLEKENAELKRQLEKYETDRYDKDDEHHDGRMGHDTTYG